MPRKRSMTQVLKSAKQSEIRYNTKPVLAPSAVNAIVNKLKQTNSLFSKKGRGGRNSSSETRMTLYDEKTAQRSMTAGGRTLAPVAVGASRSKHRSIGMGDISGHDISWICGFIYVGNGTLGATDAVFFSPVGQTANVIAGNVPVAGGDAYVGASYVSDVEKHFARKRVRAQWMEIRSLNPSTSNAMEVFVAPVKGATSLIDTTLSAGAQVATALNKVMSMVDYVAATSWEDAVLDFKKYIGGGYGANQNEFVIDNPASATRSDVIGGQSGELLVPSCFTVSGVNTTAALRGTNTHICVMHQTVDYLDYIGANSADEPIGVIDPKRPNILGRIERTRKLSSDLRRFSDSMDRKDAYEARSTEFPSLRNRSADEPELMTPARKIAAVAAAGELRLDISSASHFDEKERFSPKRSSSLTRPTLVGSKR